MRTRHGYTLPELLLMIVLLLLLTGTAAPSLHRWRDADQVRQAQRLVLEGLDQARLAAIRLGVPATLDLTPGAGRLTARWGGDTLTLWQPTSPLPDGVLLQGTGAPLVFTPAGITMGVANRTLTLRRGSAVRTVVLSRLGRITLGP